MSVLLLSLKVIIKVPTWHTFLFNQTFAI